MEPTTDTLGFWDRIQAICRGLEPLYQGSGIQHVSYNFLDFLVCDFLSGGLERLEALVVSLAGFAGASTAPGVISLATIRDRLRDRDLTAEKVAIALGELQPLEDFLSEGTQDDNRGRSYADSRLGIFDYSQEEQTRHRLRSEWEREKEEVISSHGYEKYVEKWGSLEVLKFVRKVGRCYFPPEFYEGLRKAVEALPTFLETSSGIASDESTSTVEHALPKIDDPALYGKFCREIHFYDRGLPPEWLANPADASLDGKIVLFEKGDEILFNIEKMLNDKRCSLHSDLTPRAAKENFNADTDPHCPKFYREIKDHYLRSELRELYSRYMGIYKAENRDDPYAQKLKERTDLKKRNQIAKESLKSWNRRGDKEVVKGKYLYSKRIIGWGAYLKHLASQQ